LSGVTQLLFPHCFVQYLTFFYLSLAYVVTFSASFCGQFTIYRGLALFVATECASHHREPLDDGSLFIPVFYLLMSGFNCGGSVSWMVTLPNRMLSYASVTLQTEAATQFREALPVECYSGAHLAQVVVLCLCGEHTADHSNTSRFSMNPPCQLLVVQQSQFS